MAVGRFLLALLFFVRIQQTGTHAAYLLVEATALQFETFEGGG